MTRFVCVLLPSAMTLIVLATLGAIAVTRAAADLCRRWHANTPHPNPVQPPGPPTGVYRVPTWAARTPAALRQHPDLAQLDQHLDTQYAQLATYYPAAGRSDR